MSENTNLQDTINNSAQTIVNLKNQSSKINKSIDLIINTIKKKK